MSRVRVASKILSKTVLATVDELVMGRIHSGRDLRKDSIAGIDIRVNVTTVSVLVGRWATNGNLLTMLDGRRLRSCHYMAMP